MVNIVIKILPYVYRFKYNVGYIMNFETFSYYQINTMIPDIKKFWN